MGFRVFRFLGRFLVLTGFLGSASALVWHWQGTCGNNSWYSVCSGGSCQEYYTLYVNNWGATACNQTPPFPGTGDTVVIPEGAHVVQDGDVAVGRIVIEEGGTLDWQVGYLSVSDILINHGRFLCNGNTISEYFAGVLQNEGTVQDSGGPLQLGASAVILNDTGAQVVLWSGGSINGVSDTAYLVNRGILKKISSGWATLGPRLQVFSAPSGTLKVLEGGLNFQGRFDGRVYLAGGTSAYLYGNAHLVDTVLFWGSGTLQILENPTVVAGSQVTSALQAPGRVLWANGTLTIDTGARWINEGEFVTRNNTTLQGTLENRGTLVKTSTSPWYWSNGTTVINDPGGLLDLRAGRIEVPSGAEASLINRGTVLRDSAGTVNLYRMEIRQRGRWRVSTGTLYLIDAGFTQDSGRSRVSSLFWSTQPLQFQHGRVEGTGTLRSLVVFQGDTLAPGDSTGATGVLKVQGSVVLGSASVWNEEVGGTGDAGQDFDALQVDGQSQDSVVLQNGVLRVVLVQGYTPSEAGDSVPILTWDSQVTTVRGSFGEVVLANAPATVHAWLTWGPSALYLHLADTENHTGDVNNDGQVDVLDVEYLANYLYEKGPAPPVPGYADLNGDTRVDDRDLVALTHQLWQAR